MDDLTALTVAMRRLGTTAVCAEQRTLVSRATEGCRCLRWRRNTTARSEASDAAARNYDEPKQLGIKRLV